MNNKSHKALIRELSSGAIPADELSVMATEMRRLWHHIIRGDHSQPHTDKQQFWVLGALEGGPRRMSALAEVAQTSQASLTGIVDRLEEQGLVERSRSADDRRVVDVTLTEAGRSQLLAGRAAFVARLEDVLSPLDAPERALFLSLLRKLTASFPDTPPSACS